MRYFLDTEFIERGPQYPIELISLGIVREDESSFYAVSSEFRPEHANEWVKANVLAHLGNGHGRYPLAAIAQMVREFIGKDKKPEFWGYYADYDWVVFAQMFGTMMDLPEGWPMYCRDLKQWADALGNPKLPEQSSTEHNALNDARWNRKVYDFLFIRQSRALTDI
jgi:hypothetical protein